MSEQIKYDSFFKISVDLCAQLSIMRPTSTGNALKRQPGNNALGLIGSGFQPDVTFEEIQKKH
tara:strand:- start:259 stop:447 length:189 start_codon:yes stop_codon:yes gene_type:complete